MGGSVQLEVERYDIVMLNKSEVAPDETGRRDDPKYKPTAIQSSTSTTLTTAPPSSTPSANPNSASPPGTSSSTGPNTGLIAVAVCTPVITIALVLIFWLLYRRRKHTRAHPHPPPPPPMASSSTFRVKPSAPSPAELITESQSRDVGRHVFGDPPQQVPLLMHVGGKLYSPEELGANEGTGAELHGRSMAGYEMEGERAVQEMGDHDGHGGAGGWWKRMSRSQSKRDRF
ncbi:hypothetical protein DFH27DRAFT_277380 [Peziza echinospora]|nr:hypothetical protein DFH27DRAFT_277380 [Peziza echinospora]